VFTSLAIENFRGFRELVLDSLQRVNLIVGSNDVGKTALLEAIFLLIGEANVANVPRISAARGLGRVHGDPNEVSDWFWSPIFYRYNTKIVVKISGNIDGTATHRVELRFVPRASARATLQGEMVADGRGALHGLSANALEMLFASSSGEERRALMLVDEQGSRVEPPAPEPALPGYLLSARVPASMEDDARIFGMLEVLEEPYDVLDVLRIVEPRLTRLRTIPSAGGTIIYGDIGIGRMIPLALMGDGLVRLASLVVRIATAPGGVVLVDEVENGLYHTALCKVWSAIGEAARRFNVQVFATTHSWECLRAAHRAFEASSAYDLGLYRLERTNGDIRAVAYDRETIGTSIEANLEVR
jgi:hypothetical protein